MGNRLHHWERTIYRYRKGLMIFLFLLLAAGPLFYKLDAQSLRLWDESLFALRAYHIATEFSYLYNVDELEYGRQLPNTKPPLFSCVQAAFMHLVGYNVLALRLPVALCALTMMLGIIAFFNRYYDRIAMGMLSALILLTSPGFIRAHMARTGDHDVPLALCTLLVALGFFLYLQSGLKYKRYIWLTGAALLAGFMIKSSLALLFLPALAVWTAYRKQLGPLLQDRHFYGMVVITAGIGALYLGIQEWSRPGFISSVIKGQGYGRLINTIDGHHGSIFYYIKKLGGGFFLPWGYLLPFSVLVFWLPRFRYMRNLTGYLWLIVGSSLLILSLAQTKLGWYAASLYPLLAMLAGITLYVLLSVVQQGLASLTHMQQKVIRILLLLYLFVYPYWHVMGQLTSGSTHEQERFGYYFRNMHKQPEHTRSFRAFDKEFNLPLIFYKTVFNRHYGYNIDWIGLPDKLHPGDTILVCDYQQWQSILHRFETTELNDYWGCHLVRIVAQADSTSVQNE